jgi:hypothetical protein
VGRPRRAAFEPAAGRSRGDPVPAGAGLAGRRVGRFSALGSEITNSVQGLFIYDAWENVSFAAGYRALWVDYDNGKGGTPDYFAYDTVTHGPQIGIIFRF